MASTPPPPPSALLLLQSHFALSRVGGEIRVIDLGELAALKAGTGMRYLHLYKKADAILLMQRFLETQPVPCDPKRTIANFFTDPATRVFDRIAFDPRPTPLATLNLWAPSPVQPIKGDWSILGRFLLDVICSGDTAVFGYLIQFLAHMLQYPQVKPGIVPVMIGGQGIGKGTLFALLRAIWPGTTLVVEDVNHITGGFNSVLECVYVVCLDEAIFKGDRKALDRMKSLITEPEITIEAKYQPRRSLSSFHRFFAASNHDHFAHVEPDDRRFLFLRISDARKCDFGYFGSIYAAISDPATIAALVHDLLHFDLSKFNVRHRPRTVEHTEQKLHSLTGFNRYWFDVLSTGWLSQSAIPMDSWVTARFVASTTLTAAYREFGSADRHDGTFTERDLASALERLCPSAIKGRHKAGGPQHRGYDLPTLAQARREFEHVIGASVVWST
jgi:hypothetical protein